MPHLWPCIRLHRTNLRSAAMAAALLIFITGCTKPNIGIVTGTVTVDGTRAKTGSIAFFPSDPKASTAGAEIVDGKYRAQVPPGTAKVEIRVSKVVGQKKLYNTANS